jgi:hypothetical protein
MSGAPPAQTISEQHEHDLASLTTTLDVNVTPGVILPIEITCEILSLLDQPELSACLRVNTNFYAAALPLLYRRIAIPPVQAGTLPHDVRDAHAPKPHSALRGPNPRMLVAAAAGLHLGTLTSPAPATLVRDLVIPQHDPSSTCIPLPLSLRTVHLVLGSTPEIHRTPTSAGTSAAFLDLVQRGQARTARGSCALLDALRVDTLVVHRAGLLYARLNPSLLPASCAVSRRVVLLIPPDRATAGSSVKFEYPWAGAKGVLGFLAIFNPGIEAVLVFDVDAGERWKPIPRPKDGEEDGVPLWFTRFVRLLARGVGERKVVLVNVPAVLDPDMGRLALASVQETAARIAAEARCTPLRFVARDEWRREGVVDS